MSNPTGEALQANESPEMQELKEILAKMPKDWTTQERAKLLTQRSKIGKQALGDIRKEVFVLEEQE